MLLHTEYSLLSLLHGQDGVVHHHGLFKVCPPLCFLCNRACISLSLMFCPLSRMKGWRNTWLVMVRRTSLVACANVSFWFLTVWWITSSAINTLTSSTCSITSSRRRSWVNGRLWSSSLTSSEWSRCCTRWGHCPIVDCSLYPAPLIAPYSVDFSSSEEHCAPRLEAGQHGAEQAHAQGDHHQFLSGETPDLWKWPADQSEGQSCLHQPWCAEWSVLFWVTPLKALPLCSTFISSDVASQVGHIWENPATCGLWGLFSSPCSMVSFRSTTAPPRSSSARSKVLITFCQSKFQIFSLITCGRFP